MTLNIFNQITHFKVLGKMEEKRKRKTIGKSTNNTCKFSHFFLSNLQWKLTKISVRIWKIRRTLTVNQLDLNNISSELENTLLSSVNRTLTKTDYMPDHMPVKMSLNKFKGLSSHRACFLNTMELELEINF